MLSKIIFFASSNVFPVSEGIFKSPASGPSLRIRSIAEFEKFLTFTTVQSKFHRNVMRSVVRIGQFYNSYSLTAVEIWVNLKRYVG